LYDHTKNKIPFFTAQVIFDFRLGELFCFDKGNKITARISSQVNLSGFPQKEQTNLRGDSLTKFIYK